MPTGHEAGISDTAIETAHRVYGCYPVTPRPPPITEYSQRLQGYACTLEDVALELGLSRERIRQIEREALRKCRWWCERNGYWLEDLLLCTFHTL